MERSWDICTCSPTEWLRFVMFTKSNTLTLLNTDCMKNSLHSINQEEERKHIIYLLIIIYTTIYMKITKILAQNIKSKNHKGFHIYPDCFLVIRLNCHLLGG